MKDARSKIARELDPLWGLFFGLAGPILLPIAMVLASPDRPGSASWMTAAGWLLMLALIVGTFVRLPVSWIRQRRARYASPLHRLQEWRDDAPPEVPEAADYDRWRGTLADRISLRLDPPLTDGARKWLEIITMVANVVWLALFVALWSPEMLSGVVDPYDPSLYGLWLGAFATMSGIVMLTGAWAWASRTRREINSRAAASP